MTGGYVRTVTTLTPYVMRFTGERMRTGQITPDTAHSYQNHLVRLDALFGNRQLEQLGPWLIDRWLEVTKAEWRPATRATRLCTIRQFAGWLVDQDLVRKDFTRGTPNVHRPRQEPRDIQLGHFIATLAECHTSREHAVVWLAYGLGLRCVEISRATVDDWDTAVQEIHVVGKARHERNLPVPTIMRAVLANYLRERGAQWGPLIHNEQRPGEHLSASRISNMVSRIIARTGLKARPYDGFSAHGLRSGAASDLLEACGGDLRVVMEFLGHANLATTSIYTRRAGRARMRDALELRQWSEVA